MREYKFNEARSNQALEGIYSTVVLRDILQRNNGADQSMLQKIMLFCVLILVALLLRIVSEMYFPMKAIFRLENQRILQVKTVDKYIAMLRNAFVIFSVGRYDVKGKQLLKHWVKNYIIDMGFRNMLLGYRDADRGHIIAKYCISRTSPS